MNQRGILDIHLVLIGVFFSPNRGYRYVQITSNYRYHLWHLDRIDQANLPLSDSFEYANSAGHGVEIIVLE